MSDRLAEIALQRGERLVGGGNRPIALSEPGMVWYVVKGAVDVFAAQQSEDGSAADFKQLLRLEPGRLIFGVARDADAPAGVYIGKGLPDTEVRCLPVADVAGADAAESLAREVEAWVRGIAATIARDIIPRPRPERFLSAGDDVFIEEENVLTTRGGVVWVQAPARDLAFLDTGETQGDGPGYIAVTAHSWLRLFRPARLQVVSTRTLQAQGLLLPALSEFHRVALAAEETHRRLMLVDMANLLRTQGIHRSESEARARDELFGVLEAERAPARGGEDGSVLRAALERIGDHEGIEFRFPPASSAGGDDGERGADLAEIQRISSVRSRTVRLPAEERWWLGKSGALLARRRESGAPVALVPGALGRYRAIDADTGRAIKVDARLAAELEEDAESFYSPFPPSERVSGRALLRFGLRGLGWDVARFAVAGLAFGLLMLTPAIFLGNVVDNVIPSGSPWFLAKVGVTLVLLAAFTGLALVLQGMAMMRVEAVSGARLGAAVWDRVLNQPQGFFRRFAAGELAMRAMAFQHVRDQVSGVVANSLLAVIFLLPTFALLFWYDATIGWLGLALGLGSAAVTLVFALRQLPHHRRLLVISERLTGKLVQLLNGIGKLRSTGSEGIGFALWAKDYRAQKQTEMRLGQFNEHLVAFLTAAPLLAASAVFAATMRDGAGLGIGDFLTVYVAFMAFYAAVAGLGGSVAALVAVLPAYEHTKPILDAPPQSGDTGEPPPDLSGEVHLDHVSFRYGEDGPLVLRDLSIHARAGEFVAIVGESGAGKSTLFRLALGLETPLAGTVYYDGLDLGRLNKRAVRSRIGMVVQDASMQPGTVFENIIGVATDLTEDDAWRAARLAAVDEDIAAMPMQMHTPVGESAMFSGGQVQRIMLAAALARDPCVLFLDEATNWLDNKSQARVMESVTALAVTRFVSAHRLSTIRMADSIYVLQDGQIAQSGTFDELVEAEGPFRDLVQRQIA